MRSNIAIITSVCRREWREIGQSSNKIQSTWQPTTLLPSLPRKKRCAPHSIPPTIQATLTLIWVAITRLITKTTGTGTDLNMDMVTATGSVQGAVEQAQVTGAAAAVVAPPTRVADEGRAA